MGYGDWVISQQIVKKIILCARHAGGEPRSEDVRGRDFRNPGAFRMCDVMAEDAGGNTHKYRGAWE